MGIENCVSFLIEQKQKYNFKSFVWMINIVIKHVLKVVREQHSLIASALPKTSAIVKLVRFCSGIEHFVFDVLSDRCCMYF